MLKSGNAAMGVARALACIGGLFILSGIALQAATVKGNHIRPAIGPLTGGDRWWITKPKFTDSIQFGRGTNWVDNAACPATWLTPEPKFNPGPGGTIVGRMYTALGHTCVGVKGSTATNVALGWSTVTPGTGPGGMTYLVSWGLHATGTLGALAPPPPAPGWDSRTHVIDPFGFDAQDFVDAGIGGETFSMYMTLGFEGGTFSPNGWISSETYIETASGSTNVLSIAMNDGGAFLTTGVSEGLSFFLLDPANPVPTEDPAQQRTLSEVEALLNDDVLGDNEISEPLSLGIRWQGLAVPSTPMADGMLLRQGTNMSVGDLDAVPEPPALLALGSGLAALAGMVIRRRR